MIPASTFSGKKVAVFGLGVSGMSAALSLKKGGALVCAWDEKENVCRDARDEGIDIMNPQEFLWETLDYLVVSPGVPLTHPNPHWIIEQARKACVPIIGDIEIFCRERAARAPESLFIAITGTNGKSTTTALISHILECSGKHVEMGGNIGMPILSLQDVSDISCYVVEMSSFQIDLTPSLHPTIGILLNITPDHLDRHGTLDTYAQTKEKLISASDCAIVGDDDPLSRNILERSRMVRRTIAISGHHGCSEKDAIGVTEEKIISKTFLKSPIDRLGPLKGAHNYQNAAAACAVCSLLGMNQGDIEEALQTFQSLPHRMEEIASIDSVLFVNDSKATNNESTEKAMRSYQNILWIVGGYEKEDIDRLSHLFPRILKAFTIGRATEYFSQTLTKYHVDHEKSYDLRTAVWSAYRKARSLKISSVVLLSPACASYDQYQNFEERGEHFRTIVYEIQKSRICQ